MKDDDHDEREKVAERLRRVRDEVRRRALTEDAPTSLPPPRPVREPERPSFDSAAPPDAPGPARPDGAAVNALWRAEPGTPARGLRGRLGRWLRGLLAPHLDAQVAFNSRQVQLDNELLDYVDRRFEATHRHYDDVLGRYGRHMGEIDERHMIVQEELVAHVHDLVKRIDLVLSESERGRLELRHDLEDLRGRLARLEERLRGA